MTAACRAAARLALSCGQPIAAASSAAWPNDRLEPASCCVHGQQATALGSKQVEHSARSTQLPSQPSDR